MHSLLLSPSHGPDVTRNIVEKDIKSQVIRNGFENCLTLLLGHEQLKICAAHERSYKFLFASLDVVAL